MRKLLPWVLGAALAVPTLSAVVPAPAAAQETCPAPSPSPEPSAEPVLMPEELRLALFDAAWGTIDAAYLDPAFNGVDWEAIGDEYAPLFLQVEDAWQVYDLVEEMVGALGDEETRFISPLIIENLQPGEQDYVGIGALVDTTASDGSGGGPRVLYLFPGSGAGDAGLQPRDRILSVNGDPCVTIAAIRGPEGTTVTLMVASPGEAPREVVVERRRIDPTILPITTTLAGGTVGYIRPPSMEGQALLDGITETLDDYGTRGLEGLILDVRSVGIGGLGVTVGILSHLLEGDAGMLYSRSDSAPIELPESDLLQRLKDLPIVVLVDEDTGGEAERLAAMLQGSGRATVVGQPTEGRTRGIQEVPFQDRSVLQVVTVGLELADGTRLGQDGITPDVPVEGDWLSYPEAEDPWLVAALQVLEASPGASPGS